MTCFIKTWSLLRRSQRLVFVCAGNRGNGDGDSSPKGVLSFSLQWLTSYQPQYLYLLVNFLGKFYSQD